MHIMILPQTDCIVFETDCIVSESDGLFSLSAVLSSSFVRTERFYCSIVSDLENFFTKTRLKKFFKNSSYL